MKMINKLKGIAILSLGILLMTGCKDEKSDYVNLSTNSYTFDPKGEEMLEITIDASTQWNVEIADEWVLEKEKDNNKIVIGVEPSRSNGIRSSKIYFTAGEAKESLTISQLGTNVTYAMMDNNILTGIMSPNGTYVAGVNSIIVNNAYQYTPFYINVATGQRTIKNTLTDHSVASAIADNELFFFNLQSLLQGRYYIPGEDEPRILEVPSGFEQPTIEATSADGRIFVGYARSIPEGKFHPFKWVDYEYEMLEMPDETLTGNPINQGVMARGCSIDGSVIYGSVWDDFSAVYWKDGKVNYVSQNDVYVHDIIVNDGAGDVTVTVVDKPVIHAQKDKLSPNGRYLAVEFSKITSVNKIMQNTHYPAVFDTETLETIILTELPTGFTSGSAQTVSDNGLMAFGCPALGATNGFVYNMQTGRTTPCNEYILQEYGFQISAEESHINKITNNGKTVLGTTVVGGGTYIQYWYLNVAD